MRLALALVLLLVPAGAARADWCPPSIGLAPPPGCAERTGSPPLPPERPDAIAALAGPGRICELIESAAGLHGLDPHFFARLIWKESRFDIRAISPVGAQGVAQFMPDTARLRGLANPWDPEQAIPASAHFLADLKARFGNFGLAAAGYNSGPDRVANWLAKGGRLPSETVNYVQSITFRPVEWFREAGREVELRPLEKGRSFAEGCRRLPVIHTRAMGVATSRPPWGVQIAAGISHRAALRAFSRARAQLRSVVGGRGAVIVRSRKGGRSLYSARLGVPSRAAARALCARIKRIGGNCVVRRN